MSDPTALTIAEAAARVDAVELLEAYLARIDRLEPALNCFITLSRDTARADAEAAAARARTGQRLGPLDGIPVAFKDNIDLAGMPTTNGFGPAATSVPEKDAAVVQVLRAAGAVLLGKLNMHEGALGATTDNPHHGRTENPWRAGFTPGGSSGGSGAAVAARLAAATLGTDTMGSVRLPAAYCGVVGFKPSHDLIGRRGLHMLCEALDDIGPLARSVGDAALMLQATTGVSASDTVPLAGLKLGIVENFSEVELEADVGSAFEAALTRLGRAGAAIERLALPGYVPTLARRAGLLMVEAEGWRLHGPRLTSAPAAFSPEFSAMLAYGRDAAAERVERAAALVREVGAGFAALLDQVDAIFAPTAAEAAFPFGTPAPASQADLTAPANFAGAPAISLPMGLSSAGLPLGLQLIARPGADARLLGLAQAVEAVLPEIGLSDR